MCSSDTLNLGVIISVMLGGQLINRPLVSDAVLRYDNCGVDKLALKNTMTQVRRLRLDDTELLTCLTIAEVGHPEILVVGIDECNERSRTIHAQPDPLPISAAFMLIVNDAPYLCIRVVI